MKKILILVFLLIYSLIYSNGYISITNKAEFLPSEEKYIDITYSKISKICYRIYSIKDPLVFFSEFGCNFSKLSNKERISSINEIVKKAGKKLYKDSINFISSFIRIKTNDYYTKPLSKFSKDYIPVLADYQLNYTKCLKVEYNTKKETKRIPLDIERPGLYLSELITDKKIVFTLINITKTGIVCSSVNNKTFFIVFKRKSKNINPLPKVPVYSFTTKNSRITKHFLGRTSEQGICKAVVNEKNTIVMAINKGEVSFLHTQVSPHLQSGYIPYIKILDKNIKIGESFSVLGIIRYFKNKHLYTYKIGNISLTIKDTKNQEIFSKTVHSSANGDFMVNLKISDEIKPGDYFLYVKFASKIVKKKIHFYSKPQTMLFSNININQKNFVSGDTIKIRLKILNRDGTIYKNYKIPSKCRVFSINSSQTPLSENSELCDLKEEDKIPGTFSKGEWLFSYDTFKSDFNRYFLFYFYIDGQVITKKKIFVSGSVYSIKAELNQYFYNKKEPVILNIKSLKYSKLPCGIKVRIELLKETLKSKVKIERRDVFTDSITGKNSIKFNIKEAGKYLFVIFPKEKTNIFTIKEFYIIPSKGNLEFNDSEAPLIEKKPNFTDEKNIEFGILSPKDMYCFGTFGDILKITPFFTHIKNGYKIYSFKNSGYTFLSSFASIILFANNKIKKKTKIFTNIRPINSINIITDIKKKKKEVGTKEKILLKCVDDSGKGVAAYIYSYFIDSDIMPFEKEYLLDNAKKIFSEFIPITFQNILSTEEGFSSENIELKEKKDEIIKLPYEINSSSGIFLGRCDYTGNGEIKCLYPETSGKYYLIFEAITLDGRSAFTKQEINVIKYIDIDSPKKIFADNNGKFQFFTNIRIYNNKPINIKLVLSSKNANISENNNISFIGMGNSIKHLEWNGRLKMDKSIANIKIEMISRCCNKTRIIPVEKIF